MRRIKFAFAFVCALVLGGAGVAYAADSPCTAKFCPLADVGNSRLGAIYGSQTDLSVFLTGVFTTAISIGAILGVLRVAWAGYQYMTSETWGNKGHAKDILGDVTLGLLLLLGCWLILKQINPQILDLSVLKSLQDVKTVPAAPLTTGPL